MDDFGAPM